ncbi:MAG: thioredoxin family protein [Bacilli bacterium]
MAETKKTKTVEKKTQAKKTAAKKTETNKKANITKKVVEPKTTNKKTTTIKKEPKTSAKKEVKKVTKKIETNKTTASQKKVVKKAETKETKKVSNPRVLEVVENIPEIEPIITKEIDKEEVEEKLLAIKKEEKGSNIIISILLIIMVILFIAGVIYIYDYTKKNKENGTSDYTKYSEKGNVSYNKKETDSTTNNSTDNSENKTEPTYANLKTITINEYEKKLNNNEKMIVVIARTGCGPCSVYLPTLNEVLDSLKYQAYKIDIASFKTQEENNLFRELFTIKGTPTTVIVNNKEIKYTLIGNQSKEIVTEWIKSNYEEA